MTGLTPGDRVHVAFDGTVNNYNIMTDKYSVEGDGGGKAFVRVNDLTKYDPPAHVGDVLTGPGVQYGDLPVGSVVQHDSGVHWTRLRGGWVHEDGTEAFKLYDAPRFTVKFVADGAA